MIASIHLRQSAFICGSINLLRSRFSLGASAIAAINNTGISSSEAKLTYGVNLQGKAYAYWNGTHLYNDWIYAPKSLQGEVPFSFGYNFGE